MMSQFRSEIRQLKLIILHKDDRVRNYEGSVPQTQDLTQFCILSCAFSKAIILNNISGFFLATAVTMNRINFLNATSRSPV
jgi:hypothetical protein